MAEELWRLTEVRQSGDRLPRLDAINLGIGGGVTAVLGPSGAGKTSLLNLLVRFERPEAGRVEFTPPETDHALPAFWVPQNGGLWPQLTVRDHVDAVLPSSDTRPAADWLAAFDLEHRADAFPAELAQGERMRLSVARALAANAAVLVMDEPLAHVDPARVGRYWDVIRAHVHETGASLVFATHSARRVLAEAPRAICLKEGRLIYQGDVDTLYHRPSTPEQAECLGEGNWFEPDDARKWLGDDAREPRFCRSEGIALVPATDGPFRVRASRSQGVMVETDLEIESTGEIRRFYHQAKHRGLEPGVRVRLTLLLLLLIVALGACGDAGGPLLEVKDTRAWMLPADGPRLPAPRSLAIGRDDELVVLDDAGRVLVLDRTGRLLRQWRMPAVDAGRPEGVCVLQDGRIAVADTHYHRVLIFDATNGAVLTTLGREGREDGEFHYPVAVVEDATGNLYVCEYGSNDRVQKFDSNGRHLLTFGHFGTDPDGLQRPSGMVWHAGEVFVADAINNRIQVFSDSGRFLRTLGGSKRPLDLEFPHDLARGPNGTLFVVEYGAGRLTWVDGDDGRVLGRFGRSGTGPGCFRTPWGLAVRSQGDVLVADTGNRRIVELLR